MIFSQIILYEKGGTHDHSSNIIYYRLIGQHPLHFPYIKINLSNPFGGWKCALYYIMLILIPSKGGLAILRRVDHDITVSLKFDYICTHEPLVTKMN